MFVFDDDLVEEPFAVLVGGVVHHVLDVVEAAGLFAIGVSGVDLGFEAFVRPVGFLKRGVEVDAAVGFGEGLDLGLEVEVFEVVIVDGAFVEEVGRTFAVDDDHAVFNLERLRIGADLPAVEGLAVEERIEAVLVGLRFVVVGCEQGGKGQGAEAEHHHRNHSSHGFFSSSLK